MSSKEHIMDSEIVKKMIDKNHQYWKEQAIQEIQDKHHAKMEKLWGAFAYFILGFLVGGGLVLMFWLITGVLQ